jgi:hypothetical protein
MNKIIRLAFPVTLIFTPLSSIGATPDAREEQETVVKGYAKDASESKAHDTAVADCMNKLATEKGKCEGSNGVYREVSCGVKCENKMDQWECNSTGTAYCHQKM